MGSCSYSKKCNCPDGKKCKCNKREGFTGTIEKYFDSMCKTEKTMLLVILLLLLYIANKPVMKLVNNKKRNS